MKPIDLNDALRAEEADLASELGDELVINEDGLVEVRKGARLVARLEDGDYVHRRIHGHLENSRGTVPFTLVLDTVKDWRAEYYLKI
jgi:hypothetical protein